MFLCLKTFAVFDVLFLKFSTEKDMKIRLKTYYYSWGYEETRSYVEKNGRETKEQLLEILDKIRANDPDCEDFF